MAREDGYKNLVPYNERSKDEARSNGQKGGKKSGETRREKKRLRDCAELLLSLPVADTQNWNCLAEMGVPVGDIDYRMLMMKALLREACMGNVQAAKEIRDLIGEAGSGGPSDEREEDNLFDAIGKAVKDNEI